MTDDVGIPGYLLWRAANLWQKRIRAVLTPYGVTPVQYLLLAGLRDLQSADGQPVKQAVVARYCQSDPMMTSQVLRALVKSGFVERRAHAEDGRAFAVALSESGSELLRRAEADVIDADGHFHDPLGAEKDMFGDALRLVAGVRPRRRVKALSNDVSK
jgi:DNA-binding MarR family transcriptional regulator